MLIYQNPTATAAPAVANATGAPGPAALYEALSNQKTVLKGQLEELTDQRSALNEELTRTGADASRNGIVTRITALDKRIASTDDQIATVDLQLAKAASVPGAVVPHVEPPRSGPPDEVFVLGGIFMFVVLLPLSIAYARRIWKRSATVVQSIPADLMARIQRIEQGVESSSLEIERIGEGQRFITKLFSEKLPALQLPARSESGEKGV